MKKVVVTGASGHIGANLVRELLERGYPVVALVRQTSLALEGLSVERVHGDLSDIQSLRKAFRGAEMVYHLAAFISIQSGDREKLESVNVEGTRNVIAACHAEAVSTLIHFSSIHALEQLSPDQEITENNPLIDGRQGGGGDYEVSKARAEKLVREINSEFLSTRIIYPTAVLGPNDFNHSLFGQVILKMAQGRLPALVSGGYNWVDARDVAWGAVEAAEKGMNGGRYILSGHYLSMTGVAAIIEALTGVPAPRFVVPTWLAVACAPLMGVWARINRENPIYTRESVAAVAAKPRISHSRATKMLAYQPRGFQNSMRDTLLYYSQQTGKPLISAGG